MLCLAHKHTLQVRRCPGSRISTDPKLAMYKCQRRYVRVSFAWGKKRVRLPRNRPMGPNPVVPAWNPVPNPVQFYADEFDRDDESEVRGDDIIANCHG